jgi:hypothetical protein
MISISPQAGQETDVILSPNSHKAGHIPCPFGRAARISTLPYLKDCLFCVVIREDV